MVWLFCILCTLQTWIHSFFGNVSWQWREGDVTSALFKNSLLFCAVQTVEKMVDIFIKDSINGMSVVQKSVWLLVCNVNWNICLWCYWCVFRMQLYCVHGDRTRSVLHNVGASEALLQLSEHIKSNPLLYGWVSPMLETRIGTMPHGSQKSSTFEGCSSGSFITPCGWTSWQGLSCNGWHQHNIWVILLSW
jgi:hypothetical protein